MSLSQLLMSITKLKNSNIFKDKSPSHSTTGFMLEPNELSYSIESLATYFHSPSSHISHILLQNTHPMLTRANTGKLRPKVFLVQIDPATIKQELSRPEWVKAMKYDYESLLNNGKWTLTTPLLIERP